MRGGWDAQALAKRYPALADHSGQRLGDMNPYFGPGADGLVLFLCHWRIGKTIAVSLPEDATPEE